MYIYVCQPFIHGWQTATGLLTQIPVRQQNTYHVEYSNAGQNVTVKQFIDRNGNIIDCGVIFSHTVTTHACEDPDDDDSNTEFFTQTLQYHFDDLCRAYSSQNTDLTSCLFMLKQLCIVQQQLHSKTIECDNVVESLNRLLSVD